VAAPSCVNPDPPAAPASGAAAVNGYLYKIQEVLHDRATQFGCACPSSTIDDRHARASDPHVHPSPYDNLGTFRLWGAFA